MTTMEGDETDSGQPDTESGGSQESGSSVVDSILDGDVQTVCQQPHPTSLTLTGSLVEGGACP